MAPEATHILKSVKSQLYQRQRRGASRQYTKLPVDLAGDPEACRELEDLCKSMVDLTLWCPDFNEKFTSGTMAAAMALAPC